jgi:uncharacterized surface protein with fasciclin (FAS1) repeats
MKIFPRFLLSAALLCSVSTAWSEDLVETASHSGELKKFVEAVRTARFEPTLEGAGPLTVFAPTDAAFAKLPPGTWDALSKDPARLSKVLAHHVIPGRVLVSEVKPGKVKSQAGDLLDVKSDNGLVTIGQARVTESDMVAKNGVIHAIDTVVLPPAD